VRSSAGGDGLFAATGNDAADFWRQASLLHEKIDDQRMHAEPAFAVELLHGTRAQQRIEHRIGNLRLGIAAIHAAQPVRLALVGDRPALAVAGDFLVVGAFAELAFVVGAQLADGALGVVGFDLPGAAQQPSRLLVVDLTEVSYFGSAGLNAMLDCRDEAAAQDVTMTLVAKHPVVTRPIEVTGLGDVLPVHPTVAAALEGTGAPG